VADINSGAGSSDPRFLTEVNGKLFFHATHPQHGSELWVLSLEDEVPGPRPRSIVNDVL
jgi:hypothetical protein